MYSLPSSLYLFCRTRIIFFFSPWKASHEISCIEKSVKIIPGHLALVKHMKYCIVSVYEAWNWILEHKHKRSILLSHLANTERYCVPTEEKESLRLYWHGKKHQALGRQAVAHGIIALARVEELKLGLPWFFFSGYMQTTGHLWPVSHTLCIPRLLLLSVSHVSFWFHVHFFFLICSCCPISTYSLCSPSEVSSIVFLLTRMTRHEGWSGMYCYPYPSSHLRSS